MADLTSLSDEELIAQFQGSQQGIESQQPDQLPQFSQQEQVPTNDLSSLSDQDLISAFQSSSQSGITQEPSVDIGQQSPVSLADRAALDIATPKGQFDFLKRKFGDKNVRIKSASILSENIFDPQGQELEFEVKTGKGFVPVDPKTGVFDLFSQEGFQEGIRDIADVAGEGTRLLFQTVGEGLGLIGGGTAGSSGGIGGLVLGAERGRVIGGAVGRATGQAVIGSVAESFGLRPDEAGTEKLSDVLQEGLIGAIGSRAAPIITKGLGFVGVGAKDLLSKAYQKTFQPFSRALMNFGSQIDPFFIKRLQEKGANLIGKEKFRDWDSFVNPILKKFQNSISNASKKASDQFEKTIRPDFNRKIDSGKVKQVIDKAILESGIKDPSGKITERISDVESSQIKEIATFLDSSIKKLGVKVIPPKRIRGELGIFINTKEKTKFTGTTLGKVWELRRALDEQFKLWEKAGISSRFVKSMAKKIRSGVDEHLKSNSNLFRIADKNFSEVIEVLNDVPFGRGAKTGAFESLLKRFPTLTDSAKNRLIKLDSLLEKKDQFLEDGLAFATAAAWYKNAWRIGRQSIVGLGIGGAGFGLGLDPQTSAALGVGSIAASNPKILLNLLKVPDGARIFAEKATQKASGPISAITRLGVRSGVEELSNNFGSDSGLKQ